MKMNLNPYARRKKNEIKKIYSLKFGESDKRPKKTQQMLVPHFKPKRILNSYMHKDNMIANEKKSV